MNLGIEKKIEAFFTSRSLAIVLISLIIIFSIIGTHIPQKYALKPDVFNTWKTNHPTQYDVFEFLGFTHLFSSIIFIFLASLLFVNTLFCTKNMVSRYIRRLNQFRQFKEHTYISGLENNTLIISTKEFENIISIIESVLQSFGFKVIKKENSFFAEKNRWGIFGTALIHISILIVILAAVYGSMGRMEGDMRLIEGQTLSEEHVNYMFINEGPFFNDKHQKFDIILEKFYPDYKDETGTNRGAAGKLAINENGQKVKTEIVYSNNLMTYKGYTFLGNVNGLAPLLILRNRDGSIYSGSYITASDLDSSGRYVASFEMGDTGLEGGLMVYMTSRLNSSEIMEPDISQSPILFLKIFDRGKEIYDGTLRLNETIELSDKILGFYDVKYWSNFYIVKDNGTLLVYAGIGLITISLVISFFIVPRRVWIEVIKDETPDSWKIYLGGRADKFRYLFQEEFNRLINRIKESL